ncbi:MAG TPA: flavin-dependent oxidoreductase [Caulobacteraceae bacterium]|jgi:2-polyprenyl-6-methoxyphenol hydroxylase-like FAD-dependent oxidoreductase|nr:flavin-dependent oxidoreductase [Caulobacteraceae bacterium]
MKPEVAIVGGGVCGLALALNLHRRGITARIYETAPEIRELGVGITLLPHAVRELSALGLLAEFEAVGIENRESCFFTRFGQLAYREPRGRFAGYPFPELGIHRGKLQGILYHAVLRELGADAVSTSHCCVGVEPVGDKVKVLFGPAPDGNVAPPVTADLVIACDGVNSAVRKQFYPDDKVVFTGINTWRGTTVRPPIIGGRSYIRVGSINTGKMVIYPIVDDVDGKGNQLINWMAEIQTGDAGKNDWNTAGRKEDFLPIYQDWKFDWLDVPAMIRDAQTILEYPMVDKEPIDRWVFGRVALAGDAAHPMYPRGSNGSAQGLIDARVLADLLARGGEVDAALAEYEATRAPQTARVVRTNRSTPPDLINIAVEEATHDKPFDDLEDFITQAELEAISERYKQIAGFSLNDFGAKAG